MFGDISPLPLGEGRILNEHASCKNSGEGAMHGAEGTIFTGVSAILSMSLRRSCRRLKQSSLCFILNGLPRPHFVRPRNDENPPQPPLANDTQSFARQSLTKGGSKVTSLAPCWRCYVTLISPPLGEGRILNELASCKNSGEGKKHFTLRKKSCII